METQVIQIKKQMLIFFGVAFALPFLAGMLMGFGYSRGMDVSVFPAVQMFYPAAGAILACLLTRSGDPLIPRKFFVGYLILTALMLLCSLGSILVPAIPWNSVSNTVMAAGSIAAWILLLTEKRDKRIAYGLHGGAWKTATAIILLYILLLLIRAVIAYYAGSGSNPLAAIAQNADIAVWAIVNFFLIFAAFFGEEYGWRYYLQPILQKKLGLVRGVLAVGVIWGLWHLPVNLFYYANPASAVTSIAGQLVTCITLGVFFGWAYLKTDNIWTVVILHYVNNNIIPFIMENFSAEALQNQHLVWHDILMLLAVNTLLFMGVLFSSYYKDYNRRLPTMDERAEREEKILREAAEPEAEPEPPLHPEEGDQAQ